MLIITMAIGIWMAVNLFAVVVWSLHRSWYGLDECLQVVNAWIIIIAFIVTAVILAIMYL